MFEIPYLDSWTIEHIHERFGEPSMNTVSRFDDQPLGPKIPLYTVEPIDFWSPGHETPEEQIKIIEFGEASFSHHERKKLRTPMPLRAPESLSHEKIWTTSRHLGSRMYHL